MKLRAIIVLAILITGIICLAQLGLAAQQTW